jgi:glycosyltransferase involved in cell wall biosynthesis
LEQNPDVAKAGVNPLAHYLSSGAYEGRDPHPQFDSSYYLKQNADVAEMRINPLVHYVGAGIAEGRDPNASFDTSDYLEKNPAVALKGFNPLVDFLNHPSSFNLRATLRNEFKESGRVRLDSEYDSNPLVSVIIPCFNHGHFLEDAVLSSLLACSHPLEIIVVDGSSTDSQSVELVDELADRYKFALIRQANVGKASARRAGIQHARGKLIQFLDADNLLNPGKIDIQVDEFKSDPEIDICISEYEQCGADGLDRRMMSPSTIAAFYFSREEFLFRWGKGFFFPIHCALLRRELLDATKLQLTTEPDNDEQTFWVEISSGSPKFKFNPAVLATTRIHSVHGPTVSVVMPCYNQGKYLDEAVQSVLRQTYQDFEIFVVDDGSTDPETIRILDNYGRPKTKLIRTSNQGLSAARNTGIKACSGKYILPLDADDKISSTYLEKAVRVLEENENVGIVYCKAELFGEVSGAWELPAYRFPDILLGNQIFCSAFFRRADWVTVNGYNPVYAWEDFDFWLSLIELGREVFCIPEALFFYRKHSDSMIAKMSREQQVCNFAQLFRNHPKLYMDNIAALLNEQPALWSELKRFIQGVDVVKDERLRLACKVVEELIRKIGGARTTQEFETAGIG